MLCKLFNGLGGESRTHLYFFDAKNTNILEIVYAFLHIDNFFEDIGTMSPLLVDSGLEIKCSYTNDQIWK